VYTTDKSHQSFLQKRDTNDIYYGYKLARCDVDEKTKNFILRVLVLGSSVWCLYDPMALPARYALGRSYYTHTMIFLIPMLLGSRIFSIPMIVGALRLPIPKFYGSDIFSILIRPIVA
jgi:hypothetical protein